MSGLTGVTGSQRQALVIAGVSRSTWHYRARPRDRVAAPIGQKDRAYPSRIDAADRAVIQEKITAGWAGGHSVDHSFASTWDEGVMLASRRSWWRIAAEIADQSARPDVPTKRGSKTPRQAPVLEASGPGQIWSWDITDLRSPWRGVAFKAYSIIDIFSRKLVGCRVEEREVDQLAVDMFTDSFAEHGIPQVVHADSGPAMRSSLLKDLLQDRDIDQTHNRPYVSNDNPFSESEFRTMKYRPNYPGTFETLEEARAYLDWYVPWYNQNHKHSGIALFSPDEVHDGSWRTLWQQRDHAHQAYYAGHPERFRRPPRTPTPAHTVGINNRPKNENTQNDTKRLHTA
ncbi:MAG TPA: DDE-type integrase/transposase/recombinase [Microbacteriaceae bacterium]